MKQEKAKIMLFASLLFIGGEAIYFYIYSEELVQILFSTSWLKTIVSFATFVTFKGFILLIISLIKRGVIELVKILIIDFILIKVFGKKKIDVFKSEVLKKIKILTTNISERWLRYNTFEKIIITIVAIEVGMIFFSFLLYLPLGRKHAGNLAKKKFGKVIISKILAVSLFRAITFWFISLPVIDKIKKGNNKGPLAGGHFVLGFKNLLIF